MIKENKSLSMTEALRYTSAKKESGAQIKSFIEKFQILDFKKAKELRKKLQQMDLLKMKETHISKIIDIMPENKENLNKIFTDIGLTEDENKQILDAIQEFR